MYQPNPNLEQLRAQQERDRDEKRIAELKRLFMKIYEDNAAGRLSDERYELLSQSYESEQKELEAEVVTLQKEIEVQKQQNERHRTVYPDRQQICGSESSGRLCAA